jgi:ribonuclease HII
MRKFKYIIGIDEVGRGPIAGPVAVCALCVKNKLCLKIFKPLFNPKTNKYRDSKKLTHQERLAWLAKINEEKIKGNISYCVSFSNSTVIDKRGIIFAINNSLENSLKTLKIKANESMVFLDGGLKAPKEYLYQETIIKGDEKELPITLASIVAKVMRDTYMIKVSKKHQNYGFEKHKGYGTMAHYNAIKEIGISPIHRKSFLRKLLV